MRFALWAVRFSMKCVLLFESVHQVMRVEKLLRRKGFSIDLIPVPREISSDCGIAVELPWEERREVFLLCEENGISILGFYIRDQEGRFEKENKIGHSFES